MYYVWIVYVLLRDHSSDIKRTLIDPLKDSDDLNSLIFIKKIPHSTQTVSCNHKMSLVVLNVLGTFELRNNVLRLLNPSFNLKSWNSAELISDLLISDLKKSDLNY